MERPGSSLRPRPSILAPSLEPFMPEIGQLNPTPRLLLGPGPSDVHPRVLTAMAMPLLGHLDPQFLAIMNETQDMLRQVFQTKNQLTVPLSGTGSAGIETRVLHLHPPSARVRCLFHH